MHTNGKATRINLLDFATAPMRAFHMTWFAFFLCFFAWFGIAPLMPIIRDELQLTRSQIGWCIIGSVAITILVRLLIGWVCDRVGPRKAYTWLLVLGSLPVMGIGMAQSYESFLIFRILIGAIGASFVITQYHTSLMFAPNCVGTANATTAGWGNLGGGVTQFVMPVVFSFLVLNLGLSEYWGWRISMFLAGAVCFLTGIAYWRLTQDTPGGNFSEVRAREDYARKKNPTGTFWLACRDRRVWALFLIYGACFGIELTINNIAALYFVDYFGLGLKAAGYAAAAFGLMNIFARTLGGVFGDLFASKLGLRGRVFWLFLAVFAEGVALICFSQMKVLALAIPSLIVFSLFVQMSEGATYSVVPFINKKALGSVSGIVGAGGNAGAVAAGFLFKAEGLSWSTGLLILGVIVTACSFSALLVRFSPEDEKVAEIEYEAARAERDAVLVEANG